MNTLLFMNFYNLFKTICKTLQTKFTIKFLNNCQTRTKTIFCNYGKVISLHSSGHRRKFYPLYSAFIFVQNAWWSVFTVRHINHIKVIKNAKLWSVILNSKLTFAPHITILKTRCIKALHITKVLAYPLWCAVKTTLSVQFQIRKRGWPPWTGTFAASDSILRGYFYQFELCLEIIQEWIKQTFGSDHLLKLLLEREPCIRLKLLIYHCTQYLWWNQKQTFNLLTCGSPIYL